MMLAVIDYGAANLGSVCRAFRRLGVDPVITSDPAGLQSASHIVLPGVGSFADCSRRLHEGGWFEAIQTQVRVKSKAMLGVCVGMQLLAGLGLIPGRVRRLDELGCTLRVPHVGWNDLSVQGGQNSLLTEITSGTDMYFVHSYAIQTAHKEHVWATVDYGVPLACVVGHERVMGVQFHPEKSAKAGLKLLQNFLNLPIASAC
jgi:imidazole glycerol-phosphate synthase subunit HisH